MKRVLILLLAVMSASAVFGQKKIVAVYVVPGDDKKNTQIEQVLGNKLMQAIINNGQYESVVVSKKDTRAITIEQERQHSGSVNDAQIAALGQDLGAYYVCTAEIIDAFGSKYIATKLIEVQTKKAIKFADIDAEIKRMDDLVTISEEVAAKLFGTGTGNPSGRSSGANSTSSRVNGSVWNPDGIEMVYVEASSRGNVKIESFYIGKYEITQGQWQDVMGYNPAHFSGQNNPVENVSWNNVQQFISKLSARTGRNYRLPTETEWEYAAREGNNYARFDYSGNHVIGTVAWYADNSDDVTHRVGTKTANALGIYDMNGNVSEWCSDCYDRGCNYHVFRGGSWVDDAEDCRVSSRDRNSPTARSISVGFRLACTPK
jgi:TolB-like protein